MKSYFTNQITKEERENILDKHKSLYDGYAVRQNTSNIQPLYTQDFANDKGGITINSNGDVSTYNNKIYMKESKNICSECGLYEDVCECGQEGMYEEDCMECGPTMTMSESECMECGSPMSEGECMECGYKTAGSMSKNKFDYTEAEDNDVAMAASEEDPELGLAMANMDEGFDDFFDEDYEDLHSYLGDEDEIPFSKLHNIDGEKESAVDKIQRLKRTKGDDWDMGVEDIDFEEIDDDIRESFIEQKNQINEMFNRFKKYN